MSTEPVPEPSAASRQAAEAATFRRLLAHLQQRTEVQNIELMTLAGFCRNCLAKWYMAEAQARGIPIDYDEAREVVYGMPYREWKARHQRPTGATRGPEQD